MSMAFALITAAFAQPDPLAQWHLRHEFPRLLPPLNSPLKGIAFGNNVWVGVGSGGTILTTPDPDSIAWTIQTSGTAKDLTDALFANGVFVAVGSGGTILTLD